ncbi:MAG: hypothetical protein CMD96_04880 [Gammaproteobacteria bacterium]|nr:hypothetical protein [Gammaproteobacteria bacterium]
MDKTRKEPQFELFVKAIIKEENNDRRTIMKRIVMISENLNENDLPDVQKIFASLNRDNAKKGEKIQLEDGIWDVKK